MLKIKLFRISSKSCLSLALTVSSHDNPTVEGRFVDATRPSRRYKLYTLEDCIKQLITGLKLFRLFCKFDSALEKKEKKMTNQNRIFNGINIDRLSANVRSKYFPGWAWFSSIPKVNCIVPSGRHKIPNIIWMML